MPFVEQDCCFTSNIISTAIGTAIALIVSCIIIYYIILDRINKTDFHIPKSFGESLEQLNSKIPLTKLTQDDLKSLICKVPFAKGC